MAAAAVNQAAQRGKQFGQALDFVKDDEAVFVMGKEWRGVGEFGAIRGGFEVEVSRR